MKTKILMLGLFMLFQFSCNSDDDNAPAPEDPPIPIESRYLNKITDEDGAEIMSFSYNPDKTIKMITIGSGAIQFRYEYENGNISRLYYTVEGGTVITDFDYVNGILSSYIQDGVVNPVEYLAETNSYSLVYNENNYSFFFNENNDLIKIFQDSDEYDYEVNLFYEPKFGSLNNINSIQMQTFLGTYLNFYFYIQNFNLSNRPMESVITPEQNINYVNTYDELNGLIRSEITQIQNGESNAATFKYEFIEL